MNNKDVLFGLLLGGLCFIGGVMLWLIIPKEYPLDPNSSFVGGYPLTPVLLIMMGIVIVGISITAKIIDQINSRRGKK